MDSIDSEPDKDEFKQTIITGNINELAVLLNRRKYDLTTGFGSNQETPLKWAAQSCNLEVLRLLICHQPSALCMRDDSGFSILMHVVRSNSPQDLMMLDLIV